MCDTSCSAGCQPACCVPSSCQLACPAVCCPAPGCRNPCGAPHVALLFRPACCVPVSCKPVLYVPVCYKRIVYVISSCQPATFCQPSCPALVCRPIP
ncbi:keratin-associated protein 12-1-like [Dama dama]|uniref:keratin-associated protein 12-1-like n=1 Tax=Dama dama TaxID=30532 RepID=UPI002A3588BA|nr:keratin-associated protein 12-1-like [Dama dama]